jgi:predicted nucleic acid-binding protein
MKFMNNKVFIDSNVWLYTAMENDNEKSIHQRYALSFWDSLIVSSALETECSILYSEDMQHGLQIQYLQIINPTRVREN